MSSKSVSLLGLAYLKALVYLLVCKRGKIAVNNIARNNFKHVIMSGTQLYTQRGTQKGVTEEVKEKHEIGLKNRRVFFSFVSGKNALMSLYIVLEG